MLSCRWQYSLEFSTKASTWDEMGGSFSCKDVNYAEIGHKFHSVSGNIHLECGTQKEEVSET